MKLTNRLLTALLIILLVLLVCLHLVILPAVSGGYNDECYLSDEKRQTLRIMVQNISRVFDKYGVQYWLDYGEFCCHVSMVYIHSTINIYILVDVFVVQHVSYAVLHVFIKLCLFVVV